MVDSLVRVFVFGSPRSGTTLVQSILAAHPELVGFTESHFFDKGFSAWPAGKLNRERLLHRVESFIEQNKLASQADAQNTCEALRTCADWQAATSLLFEMLDREATLRGAKGWLDKTPDHVRRVRLIEKTCPNAKFIHVVRKPINTLLSLREAKSQWRGEHSWLRCFAHWYFSVIATLRHAKAPRHKIVLFEDVTTHPDEMARAMTGWLGLPWVPDLLERRVDTAKQLIRKDESWKANNLKPILPRPDRNPAEMPAYVRMLLRLSFAYPAILASKRGLQFEPQAGGVTQ